MPTGNLCQELLKQYQSSQAKQPTSLINSANASAQQQQRQQKQPAKQEQTQMTNNLDDEYLVAKKRRVIKFVRFWMLINREHFVQHQQIQAFVMVSRDIAPRMRAIIILAPPAGAGRTSNPGLASGPAASASGGSGCGSGCGSGGACEGAKSDMRANSSPTLLTLVRPR